MQKYKAGLRNQKLNLSLRSCARMKDDAITYLLCLRGRLSFELERSTKATSRLENKAKGHD